MSAPNLKTLWDRIGANPAGDFLVEPDARYSYADLVVAIRQWLAAFDAHGVGIGDRIVIRTADEGAAVSGLIAALLDGVVPVLLSADTPGHRLAALCETVEAAFVVTDEAAAPELAWPVHLRLAARSAKRGLFRRPAMLPGLAFAAAGRSPRLPLDEAGQAYLLFTSGTTAAPSGVAISRGNMFANLATISRVFGYTAASRIFNDMILAHADGLIQGPLLAALNGCALIRSGGFQIGRIEAWLDRVRTTRASHVITVPTIWAMIDAYAAHDDYFDAPECVALFSVAAKLPEALWQRLETRFRRPVFNQYGLTETVTSALYAGPHPEMGGFGSIGKPIDCEARIDPAADGAGELQLRGANIFAGYWRNPERTAASFVDGWLKTGDLARQRADGSFEVLGRLKTVIMSGGFLIHPDELDEAMMLHPAVRESVTVAMPDEMFDEVPVTAVVLGSAVAEAALIEHARARLEARKVPKRIVALPAIARGVSGKPNLAVLRADVAAALATETMGEPPNGGAAGAPAGTIQEIVLTAAADVFRVAPALLSLRTAQGDVPGWDSFSQIALILLVEERLGIRIPASKVAAIRTIGDLVGTAEALRG